MEIRHTNAVITSAKLRIERGFILSAYLHLDLEGGGSVSWNEGFGGDYQLADANPSAKDIGRDTFNELHSVQTTAIQQYQQFGVPEFITTAQNGGAPFPYSIKARVRESGEVYESLTAANVTTPPSAE